MDINLHAFNALHRSQQEREERARPKGHGSGCQTAGDALAEARAEHGERRLTQAKFAADGKGPRRGPTLQRCDFVEKSDSGFEQFLTPEEKREWNAYTSNLKQAAFEARTGGRPLPDVVPGAPSDDDTSPDPAEAVMRQLNRSKSFAKNLHTTRIADDPTDGLIASAVEEPDVVKQAASIHFGRRSLGGSLTPTAPAAMASQATSTPDHRRSHTGSLPIRIGLLSSKGAHSPQNNHLPVNPDVLNSSRLKSEPGTCLTSQNNTHQQQSTSPDLGPAADGCRDGGMMALHSSLAVGIQQGSSMEDQEPVASAADSSLGVAVPASSPSGQTRKINLLGGSVRFRWVEDRLNASSSSLSGAERDTRDDVPQQSGWGLLEGGRGSLPNVPALDLDSVGDVSLERYSNVKSRSCGQVVLPTAYKGNPPSARTSCNTSAPSRPYSSSQTSLLAAPPTSMAGMLAEQNDARVTFHRLVHVGICKEEGLSRASEGGSTASSEGKISGYQRGDAGPGLHRRSCSVVMPNMLANMPAIWPQGMPITSKGYMTPTGSIPSPLAGVKTTKQDVARATFHRLMHGRGSQESGTETQCTSEDNSQTVNDLEKMLVLNPGNSIPHIVRAGRRAI